MANVIKAWFVFEIGMTNAIKTMVLLLIRRYPDGKRNKTNVFVCLSGRYPDGKRNKTNVRLTYAGLFGWQTQKNQCVCFISGRYPDGKRNKTNVFVIYPGAIRMATTIKPRFS